jgi:lysophospholipase L1-like esterase
MKMTKPSHRPIRVLGALLFLLALGGCIEGDEPILVEPDGGPLFERYVSLGNSVTAGFQSSGINLELQHDAYPALLAEKAGASFGIPELSMPGCPPPTAAPLGPPISEVACAARRLVPPRVVQNVAVPGATTGDLTNPIGTGTILNTLILGGRTQVAAMLDADPTLVSVWIGNNDALSAVLTGDVSSLTSLGDFQAKYDQIVDAIIESGAQDAILIGPVDASAIIPALQPGAYFWAVAQAPPPGLPPLAVSDNCAPFTATGQPNPGAFQNLVSFFGIAAQIAAGSVPVVVDCAADAPFLLNVAERTEIAQRVGMYNAYIQQQAADNGWIYVDPASAFYGPALADPNDTRRCQLLPTATDAASFLAAVQASCPVDLAGNFFGSYFSYDGVHPSSSAHVAIADTLAQRLNAKHGLSLPVGQ